MLEHFREAERRDLAGDPGALAAIRAAAEAGLAAAQTRLGMAYQQGRGVARDYEAAARWYRLAANQGDPQAALRHDLLLASGLLVPDGLQRFYAEAVQAGTLEVPAWPEALLAMGLITPDAYREGVAVLVAAGRVSPAAHLETFVEQGLLPLDEAVRMAREQAAGGDETAACKLGQLYATHGLALAAGDPDAVRWLAAAGEQLEAAADLTPVWALLGRLHEAGQGVPADPATAYFYHGLALSYGDDASATALAALRARLSEAQLAEAEARLEGRLAELSPAGRLERLAARAGTGDVDAAIQAGMCLELGVLGEPDPTAAAGWYARAAEQGSVAALNHLAALRPAYAFDYAYPPEA